jgi:hypothetical protein
MPIGAAGLALRFEPDDSEIVQSLEDAHWLRRRTRRRRERLLALSGGRISVIR